MTEFKDQIVPLGDPTERIRKFHLPEAWELCHSTTDGTPNGEVLTSVLNMTRKQILEAIVSDCLTAQYTRDSGAGYTPLTPKELVRHLPTDVKTPTGGSANLKAMVFSTIMGLFPKEDGFTGFEARTLMHEMFEGFPEPIENGPKSLVVWRKILEDPNFTLKLKPNRDNIQRAMEFCGVFPLGYKDQGIDYPEGLHIASPELIEEIGGYVDVMGINEGTIAFAEDNFPCIANGECDLDK